MNFWAITDKGLIRRDNQDAFFTYSDEKNKYTLLVVCDGMGGANAGNVASRLAVDTFSEEVCYNMRAGLTLDRCEEILADALTVANGALYETALRRPEYSGMGTTLVAALVTADFTIIVNVGDSRAYKIGSAGILQITRDHSVVEDLVARGDITREESLNHPNKNLITRSLGTAKSVEHDIFFPEIRAGDYILLCSDGLSNQITEKEILGIVRGGNSLEKSCGDLIDLTLSRGAQDNVTVALFQKI